MTKKVKVTLFGLLSFLIAVSLLVAFYLTLGNVYEDLFEAVSQYE